MSGSTITFVNGETVTWICLVQRAQMMIAGDFGDNGSGSNGETFLIGFDDRAVGNVSRQGETAVKENKIKFLRKSGNNFFDGKIDGRFDTDFVNQAGIGKKDFI